MDFQSNAKLGRYKILSELGAGGMGEVFLAEDSRLRRKIALKILPENLATDKERLHRFEQEAYVASALNHPNILTIYEFGATDGKHFLATEYIEGSTLREKLKSDELSLADVLNIAEQIAFALSAAHAAGIVHRDLKPENVMIRADSIVKVLDFGLAKLIEKKLISIDDEAETRALVKTNPGVVMGTVSYMSPEQARGKETDARTDIFSLGVVMYEMLTGRLPFQGETTSDVIASILKSEPVSPIDFDSEIPFELERIVLKSLAKDREERYQTAKDLLVDLRRLKKQIELWQENRRSKPQSKSVESASDNATQVLGDRPTLSAGASEFKNHKLAFVVTSVVLLLAIGGLGIWYFTNREANTRQIESIAVMPFINESGNADNEYLSDGMTESLISSLSQIPKLNVKARSSVFRYKGKEMDLSKIAQDLNVQAILNGRVLQRGEQLILNLELVEAKTENVIWSEQYNRKQTDLISLQSEIASDVSHKLKTKLTGAEEQKVSKNYTANPEAYQLYLKGRFYWNKRTTKDLRKSIDYFNQAVGVDPTFALAYAALADGYAILWSYGGAPANEAMPKAREFALKALSLDSDLAEARAALGYVFHFYDHNFVEAEREYKLSIELNPQYATAHLWYGELLQQLGKNEEAMREKLRALEHEPLSLIFNRHHGESLLFSHRYDEAITQFKKTVELDPNFASTYTRLAIVYQLQGKYAESVEGIAKQQEIIGEPQTAQLLRESFAKGGWHGFLRFVTKEPPPANFSSYYIATLHTALGEKDRAFANLNKSYENREYFIVYLKVDPRLDPLRFDPRFNELLRRVGLPQ